MIYQDLPSTNLGEPLEAVVRKEGRIVVERQPTGPRKDHWLFNRATVAVARSAVRRLRRRTDRAGAFSDRLDHRRATFLHSPRAMAARADAAVAQAADSFHAEDVVFRLSVVGDGAAGSCSSCRCIGWSSNFLAFGSGTAALRDHRESATRPTAARPALIERQSDSAGTTLAVSGRCRFGRLLGARPMGWLAAIWLLVHGIIMLDLRQEPAGLLLSVLMPLDWLIGTLVLYQLVDPAIRFVCGSAVTSQGAMTPRRDGVSGDFVGAQIRGHRRRAVGRARIVQLRRHDRAGRAGHRRPGLCPGRPGYAEELLWFHHAHLGSHLSGRRSGADRRSRGLDRIGRACAPRESADSTTRC